MEPEKNNCIIHHQRCFKCSADSDSVLICKYLSQFHRERISLRKIVEIRKDLNSQYLSKLTLAGARR